MDLFYTTADGSVQGPLDWKSIKAAFRTGRILGDAKVSRGEDGPWVYVSTVDRYGTDVLSKNVVVSQVTAGTNSQDAGVKSIAKPRPYERPALAVALEVMGIAGLVGCAVCIAAAAISGTWIWAAFGVSGIVSAGMCMAIGRILSSVTEIQSRIGRE